MKRSTGRTLVGATLHAVAVTAAGCGDAAEGDAGIPVVTVAVGADSEYRFDMPDAVAEGALRINVTNAGEEPHHAQALRLAVDATITHHPPADARGRHPAASTASHV